MMHHVSPLSVVKSAAMVRLVAVEPTSGPGYVDFINEGDSLL